MAKVLVQKIQIGKYGFTGCVSTQIVKSRENFTQTAIIEIPNILNRTNSNSFFISNDTQTINKLISREDIVRIWSGYNKTVDNLPLRYSGFVSKVKVDDVVTIHCEDLAYALKQVNVPSKAFTGATVKTIVDYALQGVNITVEYDAPNTNIGDWVIDNNSNLNAIQVLEKIQKFGFAIYFQGTTLRIGGLRDTNGDVKCFIFEHNIASNNLDYIEEDNISMVIKGISNIVTNKKDEKVERYAYKVNGEIVISQDAREGEQRTLNYYNLTATDLENKLRENFDKYIYTGYSGEFQTFLEPFVSVDDFVNLYSLRYPERNGQYKVKSVLTEVGVNGGFQTIGLDYKIKSLAAI